MRKSTLLIYIAYLTVSYLLYYAFHGHAELSGDSSGFTSFGEWKIQELLGETLRPWPITLPFRLVQNANNIVILNTVFYLFSSYYLIFCIYQNRRKTFSGLNLNITLTLLSLLLSCPFLLGWTSYVLGESLSISCMCLAIGSIEKVYRGQSKHIPFLIIGLIGSFLARPIVIIPILIVSIGYFQSQKVYFKRARKISILSMIMTGLIGLYGVLWWETNIRYWDGHLPRGVTTAIYASSRNNPIGSKIYKEVVSTMKTSECIKFEKITEESLEKYWRKVIIPSAKCPELKLWQKEFNTRYFKFLITHPSDTISIIKFKYPEATTWFDHTNGYFVLPEFLYNLVQGDVKVQRINKNTRHVFDNVFIYYDPLIILSTIAAIASCLLWPRKQTNRSISKIAISPLMLYSSISLIVALGLGAIMVFGVISNQLEMARYMTTNTFLVRIIGILIISDYLDMLDSNSSLEKQSQLKKG